MNFIDRNDTAYKRLIEMAGHYQPLLIGPAWFGVCLVCGAGIPVSIDKDDTLLLHLARHQKSPAPPPLPKV